MPHNGEIDGRETVFDAGPMVWRFVDTGEIVPLRSDGEAPAEEAPAEEAPAKAGK